MTGRAFASNENTAIAHIKKGQNATWPFKQSYVRGELGISEIENRRHCMMGYVYCD